MTQNHPAPPPVLAAWTRDSDGAVAELTRVSAYAARLAYQRADGSVRRVVTLTCIPSTPDGGAMDALVADARTLAHADGYTL